MDQSLKTFRSSYGKQIFIIIFYYIKPVKVKGGIGLITDKTRKKKIGSPAWLYLSILNRFYLS